MSTLVLWAVAFALLVLCGAAWFAALGITRRERLTIEHRLHLVTGTSDSAREVAFSGKRFSAGSSIGLNVHRLFSLGHSSRWGMKATPAAVLAVGLVGGTVAWLLTHGALQFSLWICVPAAAAGFILAPRSLLLRQQRGAEQKFMMLFPDAIDMIIRMLRAGMPVTAAARTVGKEAAPPVNQVFQSIADQVDVGVPFEAALVTAGDSVGLADFRFFAVAVALQRETGGNLAITLEILADIIRKRRTVRLRAQAATGEIRMSAYILGALPFLVTATFLVISPDYLRPLATDPRGHLIVGMALLGLTLAYLSMRAMLHSVTMA